MDQRSAFDRGCLRMFVLSLVGLGLHLPAGAQTISQDFEKFLKPLFAQSCVKCHGGKKTKGKVNLKELATADQFLAKPRLIKEMLEAIDAYDMPPEDEPELKEEDRTRLLASLRRALKESAGEKDQGVNIRRLNRFQYNNAVRDLFRMNRDVFQLQEKMMTRHQNYLHGGATTMPSKVEVSCDSLKKTGGLRNVNPFPKDLRAAHGFDNQSNQLSLSPLLLDTFLKLSVSILNSPDFNEGSVGIWNVFFKEPAQGVDRDAEVRKRLKSFLMEAFRSDIDDETLRRYTAYTTKKMDAKVPFAEAMKKVASAILSSPRFLFRYGASNDQEDLFAIASNLSFLLWGSGPDQELLEMAANGKLANRAHFTATIERMMKDPKIERFLDAFPAQWMQLENVLAATPDPRKAHFFSLDKSNPASVQMVLEPLLLFDAVFLENRPIGELLTPEFSYRSDFLKAWYEGIKTPRIDAKAIATENNKRVQFRVNLEDQIKRNQGQLAALVKPVRTKLLQAKKQGKRKVVDLKPYAAWEFDGNLKDSVGSLHLKSHGNIRYDSGMVVLEKNAYLQSPNFPIDLKAKTLEVWCKIHNVDQRGGGLMGVQGPGDFFDTIVLGERKPRHWISGSNGFARTLDFPESKPEEQPNERLHLVMVYQEDGTTTLYRNGKPYGKPFRKGLATFPKNQSSIVFGVRHLPAGGDRHLTASIARARFYPRALTAEEVAGSSGGLFLSNKELVEAMTPEQRQRHEALKKSLAEAEKALQSAPKPQDPKALQNDLRKRFEDDIRRKLRARTFERVAASDPRYGGVITNAAMLSMTSGPRRTHPIARGAWIIEVIFNDPPPPPPNDVPPLNEDAGDKRLTIREKFAKHREHVDCAGCHSRLDPLGFALENYDIVGRWRDKYENGRKVDSSGTLLKRYPFDGAVRFKESLAQEDRRFAKAFTAHLLRFALAKELSPKDTLVVEAIVESAAKDEFRLKSLIRSVIMSESFLRPR